jgi:hypothetical protein
MYVPATRGSFALGIYHVGLVIGSSPVTQGDVCWLSATIAGFTYGGCGRAELVAVAFFWGLNSPTNDELGGCKKARNPRKSGMMGLG